jgi:Ni,Fe-hydrogenase III small subunit
MLEGARNILKSRYPEETTAEQEEIQIIGRQLKHHIDSVFGRSLAIREVDCGSDNSPEIELVNLTTPYYDVERYGVSFVASPRHADVLAVTGPVTQAMAVALKKTYDATPEPKLVIAIGDDACDGGIYKDSYAVVGGVEKVVPVDLKIPGNPPSPVEILRGILALLEAVRSREDSRRGKTSLS